MHAAARHLQVQPLDGDLTAMPGAVGLAQAVGDVRGEGYFFGIELVKDKATKETFTEEECERVLNGFVSPALYERGLYCRADDRGEPVIQLAPPLTCGPEDFAEMEQIIRSVLVDAAEKL